MLFGSLRNNYSNRAGWNLKGSCRRDSLTGLILIADNISMVFVLIQPNTACEEPNSEFICKAVYVICVQCPFWHTSIHLQMVRESQVE